MISLDSFIRVVQHVLPEPHAGLLNGILFGVKTSIPQELYQALVTTGTLHIAALSGMNITILESLIATTLLPFMGKRIAAYWTILVIVGFVALVGPSPSIIRASIMGTIGLLATVYGRQKWSMLSLMLALAIMLLIKFEWLWDLSFQLSALATLGIILFGSKKEKSHVLIDELRITLSAQVFTIPLIFFTFHRISIISPITNLLIGFVIPPLTALGLIMALLGIIFLPLAVPFSWVVWLMVQYLIFVIKATANLPFASIGL